MTPTTTNPKPKVYRYEISLEGSSGEFAIIPMTPEQMTYWRRKGEVSIADYLHHGDDETPPEMQLGFYNDFEDCISGIEPDHESELIVRDEKGNVVLESSILDFINDEPVQVERVVDEPLVGVFFRTYEKGLQVYELEIPKTIDLSKLRLLGTTLLDEELVNGAAYDGEKILRVTHIDKDRGFRSAEFIG